VNEKLTQGEKMLRKEIVEKRTMIGIARFDHDDHTNRKVVVVGTYTQSDRGLNAALKKLRKMFPDAISLEVGSNQIPRIAELYQSYNSVT
jgi:hypothetical protein